MSFIPLHVHSGYSFLKSGLKIDQYLLAAKKFGYDTVGISDLGNLSSAPVIYHEAEKHGIRVIFGEDLLIDNLTFSFYVLNEQGYKNLLTLSLKVEEETATIDTVKDLQEGLTVILSTDNDVLKESLLNDENDFGKKLAKLSRGITNFYIGLNVTNEEKYVSVLRDFSFSHGYKLVAFPTINYVKSEDAIILEMMKAIDSKVVLEEKTLSGNEYLLSPNEVISKYSQSELDTLDEIAKLITFKFIEPRGKMISWQNQYGLNSDEYLAKLAKDGLKAKGKAGETYEKRLNFELETIKRMGYSDYFLIVQDYVNYARNNDIAVGPGRGSASGSLVSYALGITVPDPIEHNLLFERFLNPYRQTMPDIDVDFSDIHRENIVEFLRNKYGKEKVARIMAVQTMGAKAALNDVGRIFNYDKHDIELFTKLIKDDGDDKLTLREIYKKNKDFRELVNNDKFYLEIVSLASKIEGMPRQSSLHAVGIVLNADSLIGTIPLSKAFDGGYTEQFEKDYLEEQGFLKMDILALRNLTIIEDCLTLLKQRGININRDEIPYDDPDAMKVIASGKTMGLFQLESQGMRNAIKTIKILEFEHLVQLLALYRPGPMDNIEEFARRKNSNKQPEYISPVLKEILSPTYGTIVYQEQIMQIASKMAGFTLGEADTFRRAISKKDSEKLAKLRDSFVSGAIKKGYKQEEATKVFELIDKFANYGFNRSHSVVYAIFSSRMAYLKAHYPEEFYASILSNASTTEFNNTIAEMRALNIKLLCPDINESGAGFKLKDGKILFPLSSVRGISYVSLSNILEERQFGEFKDLCDFVVRMKKYKISDQQIMNLIDAGAFDNIERSRNTLRNSLRGIHYYADVVANDQGLLSLDANFLPRPALERAEDNYLNNLDREFNSLGLMVSGSPLDAYKSISEKLKTIKINEIENSSGPIKFLAIIKNVKKIVTKTKANMAFVTVFDDSGEIEITCFARTFEKCSNSLIKNNLILVSGYYKSNKGEFSLDNIENLEEMINE